MTELKTTPYIGERCQFVENGQRHAAIVVEVVRGDCVHLHVFKAGGFALEHGVRYGGEASTDEAYALPISSERAIDTARGEQR